jgi:hypothetical protein
MVVQQNWKYVSGGGRVRPRALGIGSPKPAVFVCGLGGGAAPSRAILQCPAVLPMFRNPSPESRSARVKCG